MNIDYLLLTHGIGVTTETNTLPPPISDFNAELMDSSIQLSWTNPTDESFLGVRIQRKIGSYPTSLTDGNTIFDGLATSCLDTDLVEGATYYYRAFTYNYNNNINNDISQQTTITFATSKIYTVVINTLNANSETSVTYADDAVGMVARSNVWDNVFPFNEIKPVMFKNGMVNYYLNPNNFSQKADGTIADITSGNDGDVMIQFPKVYTYIRKIENSIYISLSHKKVDANYKCYAHTKQDGTEKDYCYIGAYNSNAHENKLRSMSGATPYGGLTMSQGRTYTEVNGVGYQLYSFYQHLMIQVLYLIKYKNLDSQRTISNGYGNIGLDSGYLNSVGMTGYNDSGIKLFGIEHLWGNGYTAIDGFQMDVNFNAYTAFSSFSNPQSFMRVGTLSKIEYDFLKNVQGTNELGFLPTEVGASSSSYFSDAVSIENDSVDQMAMLGLDGGWEAAYHGGIFTVFIDDTVNSTDPYVTTRLTYL